MKFLIVQYKGLQPPRRVVLVHRWGQEPDWITDFDNNMVKSQTSMDKNSEPTPIHSNLASSLEQVDPFGPISK